MELVNQSHDGELPLVYELHEKLSLGSVPMEPSLQAQFPDGAEDRLVEPISYLTRGE